MEDRQERQEARQSYQKLQKADYTLLIYLRMLFRQNHPFPAIVVYALRLKPRGITRLEMFAAILQIERQLRLSQSFKNSVDSLNEYLINRNGSRNGVYSQGNREKPLSANS